VLGHDLVILDPSAAFETYRGAYPSSYKGLTSFSESQTAKISSDTARRRREFTAVLKGGGTLALLTPPPLRAYIDTGQRTYSGTGRNQKTTIHVAPFDFFEELCPIEIQTELARGNNITLTATPISRQLRELKSFLMHEALILAKVDVVCAHISGTDSVVSAGIATDSGGFVLLLPHVRSADSFKTDAAWLAANKQFLDAIIRIHHDRRSAAGIEPLPEWALGLQVPMQAEVTKQIGTLQSDINDLQNRLAVQSERLASLHESKRLLTGTGTDLEKRVAAALVDLGFTVSVPDEGRTDLIVRDPDLGVAVAEVKGVAGSAAEKHAAQLEKWVSTLHADTGTEPKGLLIINAFRDVSLPDRPATVFPGQMMDYVIRRRFALVTTTQLYCALLAMPSQPDRVKAFAKALYTTIGIVEDFSEWRDFILEPTETTETGNSTKAASPNSGDKERRSSAPRKRPK
jgi:hypothetical protein